MKRKFFQILLMGAVTVSLGMFVSCKDTSGDQFNELNGKFTTLQEVMDQHMRDIQDLQDKIEELQGKVCKCDPDLMAKLKAFMDDMDGANVDAEDLKNMKDLVDLITTNYQTINNFINNVGVSQAELDSAMNVLREELAGGCPCDLARIDSIEKKAIQALNLAQDASNRLLKTDSIAKAAAQAATAAAQAAEAAGDKAQSALDLANELKQIAEAADSLSKANKQSIEILNTRFESFSDSLQNIYKYADSIKVVVQANQLAIDKLDSTVDSHKEILDDLKQQVPELYNKVDSLGQEIENLKPEITKLYEYADGNLNKAKAYTDLEIALLRAELNGIDIDALRKELGDSIFNLRVDLTDRINENTLKIGELDDKLDSIAETFKDSLDQLRSDLNDLEKRVKKNEEDIQELFGEIGLLQENLKRMVTGIIIQGTYNPAIGTLRVPANIQTNMLLSYFGYAYRDVYFPTSRTANYVDESKVLTEKDMQMIGGEGDKMYSEADLIMSTEDKNAGTLYLTVNPNTVDFSKLQLSIENSQGKESKIQLGELKHSEKLLEFGYTRAEANNGFYEAPAFLAEEDVNDVQKINFNTESVKDLAREIMNKRSSADPKKIAADIVDIIKGFKVDANCVKCEWQDSVKEGEEPVVHSVRSDYSLMAAAVKPFSLQTLKGVEPIKNFPGYNRVMNFIDKAASKIKSEVKVVFDNVQGQPVVKKIQNLKINKIEDLNGTFIIDKTITISGLQYQLDLNEDVTLPISFTQNVDFGDITVPSFTINAQNQAAITVDVLDNENHKVGTATIPVGAVQVNSETGDITVTVGTKPITINTNVTTKIQLSKLITLDDKTVPVTLDITDTIDEIWGNVQSSVNPTLEQVEDIVKDVNTLLDELNDYHAKIDAKVDEYADQVSSYVTRINNKLVSFINNFNDRLQPVLLASDGKGSKFLSEASEYPTEMGKDINFAPTTWTLEYLVPLAKKHVAVVDVINGSKSAQGGDATCLAELKRVNSSPTFNNVLPGETRRVYATDMKTGYVYVIAYSALDFHGKIAARKYYVKIK
jgi:peptidoglycan hydrolase CwlO-like protein